MVVLFSSNPNDQRQKGALVGATGHFLIPTYASFHMSTADLLGFHAVQLTLPDLCPYSCYDMWRNMGFLLWQQCIGCEMRYLMREFHLFAFHTSCMCSCPKCFAGKSAMPETLLWLLILSPPTISGFWLPCQTVTTQSHQRKIKAPGLILLKTTNSSFL